MTVAKVLQQANRGNIAGPNIDLNSVLFDQIIPEFVIDVGSASWLMRYDSATIAAGGRTFDVPGDSDRIELVKLPGATKPVPYIGEDAERVSQAEAATLQSNTPDGWYYVDNDEGVANARVKFSLPFASAITVYYAYRRRIPEDGTVDLTPYIPQKFHVALVLGVRREIMLDRYGEGDARASIVASQFEEWKDRARDDRETAPAGNFVVSLR